LNFYLAIILQLKGLDPRFEIYLLLSALEDPKIQHGGSGDWKVSERDLLNERLFNAAAMMPKEAGFDFMY
jgi:hypothetical protein